MYLNEDKKLQIHRFSFTNCVFYVKRIVNSHTNIHEFTSVLLRIHKEKTICEFIIFYNKRVVTSHKNTHAIDRGQHCEFTLKRVRDN